MAEQGNPEAKKILKNLNSMSQEQLDGELSKLFGKSGGGEKAAAPKGQEAKKPEGKKELKLEYLGEVDTKTGDVKVAEEGTPSPLLKKDKPKKSSTLEQDLGAGMVGGLDNEETEMYKKAYGKDNQMKSAKEGIKPVETDYREMPTNNELAGPEVTKQLSPLRDKYKNDKAMSRFIDDIEETHAELLQRKPKATLAATIDSYLNYNVKSGFNSKEHQDTLKIAKELGIDTKAHEERFKQVADDEAPFVELRDRLREEGNDVDEGYIMDIMDGYDKNKYNSVDEYLAEYTPRNGRESDAYDEIMATVTGAEKFEKQNPIKEPKSQMKSAKQGIKPVETPKQKNKINIGNYNDVEPGLDAIVKENPKLEEAVGIVWDYFNRAGLDEKSTPEEMMEVINNVSREFYEMGEDDDVIANIEKAVDKINDKFVVSQSVKPKGQMKSAKEGIKPVKAPKQKDAVEIVDIYDVEPGLRTVAKENPELDDAIEKINEYYYEQYNRGDLDEDSTPQQIMRALNKVGRELYEFEEDKNIKLAMKKIKEKFGGSKK
jgi:hypothetical protein